MEIKIDVSEDKFRDILEKELKAFTNDELHEICRTALIQQMSDPSVFASLFVEKDSGGWSSNAYHAKEVLCEAARNIDFSETFGELQEAIVGYIKEHHEDIIKELVINAFINGMSDTILDSVGFKRRLSSDISWQLFNRNE